MALFLWNHPSTFFCFFHSCCLCRLQRDAFFFFPFISESFLWRLSWRAPVSTRGSVRYCSFGRIECVFSTGPTGCAAASAGKHQETDFHLLKNQQVTGTVTPSAILFLLPYLHLLIKNVVKSTSNPVAPTPPSAPALRCSSSCQFELRFTYVREVFLLFNSDHIYTFLPHTFITAPSAPE